MTSRPLPPPIHVQTGAVIVPGGRRILGPLALELGEARIAVIGRNGSGKTSFMRLLAGLIRAESGAVTIAGADMYKDRREAVSQIGILFQNPDHQLIFPTVLEEMMFGLRQRGQSRAEADAGARRTLARFGKAHWADAAVVSLSQGQKHLLCLMAVVAMAPGLLILDEPFAGLDAPTRMQLRRYLDLYEGAVLHISHEPAGCCRSR